MCLSPTSMTMPPMMAGSTCGRTECQDKKHSKGAVVSRISEHLSARLIEVPCTMRCHQDGRRTCGSRVRVCPGFSSPSAPQHLTNQIPACSKQITDMSTWQCKAQTNKVRTKALLDVCQLFSASLCT